jgi:hypothetical protein
VGWHARGRGSVRVYYARGFYVVTYGLGIYLLNLLIGFLSPMVDPELEAGPGLPTRGSDEFKPFTRRLPEFKFWYAIAALSYPLLRLVLLLRKGIALTH